MFKIVGEKIQETTQKPNFQKSLGKPSAFCKRPFLAWMLSVVACQVPLARLLAVLPILCSRSKVTSPFILVLFSFCGFLHLGNEI